MHIDLNADLGEGFGTSRLAEDVKLLDLVSSANIACGFHAGDATTMRDTVKAAHERGVSIGAHPAYPDLPGFGRRELGLNASEIFFHVVSQIKVLRDVCDAAGAHLSYVKPHGALYNRAAIDDAVAAAVVRAMRQVDRSLVLLGLPGSAMETAARDAGVRFAREAFVDRAYQADGTLVPRSEPSAVIHDSTVAVERALRLVNDHALASVDGQELRLDADSLCVHGDNPSARAMLNALRVRLQSAGISIKPFTQ